MIITCIGGFNVNQILKYLDYDLIKVNPKIICGYSDITVLLHAIYAKTGLVTYHGPHFSTFGFGKEAEYTQEYFYDCIMHDNSISIEPSKTAKEYYVIQEGICEGEIIGGNLCTLNLLQGIPYMPDLKDKVGSDIPVVFGVDFGHVFPMITYPIGGIVKIEAKDCELNIQIVKH